MTDPYPMTPVDKYRCVMCDLEYPAAEGEVKWIVGLHWKDVTWQSPGHFQRVDPAKADKHLCLICCRALQAFLSNLLQP